MFVSSVQEPPSDLGAWYNNAGDLWGDLQAGADWFRRIGVQTARAGQGASNAVANVSNATSWRVDGMTVVAGAVGLGLLYAFTHRSSRR